MQVYYAFMCAPKAQLFYLGMTTLLGAHEAQTLPFPALCALSVSATLCLGPHGKALPSRTSSGGAGLTCCAAALMEHFQQPRFRALRAAMFAGLGLWGIVPAIHGYTLHHGIAIVEKAVAWDVLMGVVYLVGMCQPSITRSC